MRFAAPLLFVLAACGGTEPATPDATTPAPTPEQRAVAEDAPALEKARQAYELGDRKTWMTNMDAYLERIDDEVSTWEAILQDDEVEGVDADKLRELAATTARLQEQIDTVGAEAWQTQAEAIDEQVDELDGRVTVYRVTFQEAVDLDEGTQ